MTDTTRAGYFGSTTAKTATADPDTFTVTGAPESRHAFLVQSDVTIHVTRSATGTTVVDATTSNGLRIAEDTSVLVNAFAGDVLSFIAPDDDGTIWFTETDR